MYSNFKYCDIPVCHMSHLGNVSCAGIKMALMHQNCLSKDSTSCQTIDAVGSLYFVAYNNQHPKYGCENQTEERPGTLRAGDGDE